MAYYHHFAGWSFILVVIGLVIYYTKSKLIRLLPEGVQNRMSSLQSSSTAGGGSSVARSLYSRLPTYDWSTARLTGLHSTLFDIESNIRDGDQRTGLEAAGAQEIERLMATQGVDFDTARLMLNRQRFSKHNIDPRTGMPLDSKAVTFENLR